ncbi:plasma membrane fusion protein prm1 [Orbilia brochopaga]|uniref:Plasma membrane fusion protein PRM1 n=1 Tax=Orbilia brochopaga TaxID=3140254 RepID=A0AAV9VI05_9PEZI
MSLGNRITQSIYHRQDEAFPYPDLPPRLTPRRHPDDAEPPPVVHTVLPYHTPYLGLRARLSQVWFNRWTVLLMLIVVRTIILVADMNDDLDDAQVRAQSACTGVESMGSAMASMPHYMAVGVNEAAAQGIEAAVRGLQKTLQLALTAVEAIVIFAINVIVQTYVCLLTFAIRSSLGTVIGAASEITDFLNKTLTGIVDDIQDDAKSFEDALNKFVSGLNSIGNFFGSDTQVPKLSLPSLGELDNIKIPDSIQEKLKDLNDTIPTFDQVNTMYNRALSLPFDLIRNELNNTLTVYQFNRDVLPVPEKNTLTFCSDNPTISNFFDSIHEKVQDVRNILLGVFIALAVLVMIPMAYREWWRYRSLRQRAYMLTAPGQNFDPVDIVQIASHPYSSTLGLKAATWSKSTRRQVLIRWWFAYITSPACLFVLALGIAGLLSCLGQYVVLKAVVNATPGLANEVGEFADIVVTQLTDASLAWANDANGVVDETQSKINENVLGWVHNGSLALNNTLNDFTDTMHDGIEDIFGGTPLEDPIQNIFFCLVELKIKGIQKGLTWAHDNSQVSFPRFPNDTFSLGAATSVGPDAKNSSDSFLADSGSQAADKITEVVVRLANKYENALLIETYISAGLIGVWLFVCLIGGLRVLILMMMRDKTRAEGGTRGLTGDGRQTFGGKNDERIASVFPQFTEKSDPDLHALRDSSETEGTAATVASPTRSGYVKQTPVWVNSSHGEITR